MKFYYKVTTINCVNGTGCCPLKHAIKSTIIWELKDYCQFFNVDVGKTQARMTTIQNRRFIEALSNIESNKGNQSNANM